MAVYDKDEIAGMYDGEETVVCFGCITDEEWYGLKQDSIITTDHVEREDEKLFFCDRCNEALG